MSASITFRLSVVVEPDGESFHGYCPALKGLHVDGKTERETLKRVKDAVAVYLKSIARHKDPLPIGPDFSVQIKQRVPPPPAKTHRLDIEWPSLQMSGISSRI